MGRPVCDSFRCRIRIRCSSRCTTTVYERRAKRTAKEGRSVARNWRGLLRGPLILHFVALHVLPRTLPPAQNITIQQEPQLRFRQKPNSKVR